MNLFEGNVVFLSPVMKQVLDKHLRETEKNALWVDGVIAENRAIVSYEIKKPVGAVIISDRVYNAPVGMETGRV